MENSGEVKTSLFCIKGEKVNAKRTRRKTDMG